MSKPTSTSSELTSTSSNPTSGYFKYRCKYFWSFNCAHWSWVNGSPCAHCMVWPSFLQQPLANKSRPTVENKLLGELPASHLALKSHEGLRHRFNKLKAHLTRYPNSLCSPTTTPLLEPPFISKIDSIVEVCLQGLLFRTPCLLCDEWIVDGSLDVTKRGS